MTLRTIFFTSAAITYADIFALKYFAGTNTVFILIPLTLASMFIMVKSVIK